VRSTPLKIRHTDAIRASENSTIIQQELLKEGVVGA
jgi:hypothetical protein